MVQVRLSRDALGLAPQKRETPKVYFKMGFLIKKLDKPRPEKRFELITPPTKEWYPSKYANFTFRNYSNYDPSYYFRRVPRSWNPSLWLHIEKKLYTVRVPRDKGARVKDWLRKNLFWFDPKKYLWIHKRRARLKRDATGGRVCRNLVERVAT